MRLAFLFTLLVAAFRAFALDAPAPVAQAAPAEPGVRCVIESDCLAASARVATREGERLSIRLGDGTVREFVDDMAGCADLDAERCATYRLVAHEPASGVFVVEREGHESGSVHVIDERDGSEFRLGSLPVFSPSGQKLVSVDASEAGRSYDVSVWARRGGTWVEQTSFGAIEGYDPETWTLRGWQGEDRIALTYDTPAKGVTRGEATLDWDGQGWQVNKKPR